jgi:hypothetical protein
VVVSFAARVEMTHSVEEASCPCPLCSGVELLWPDRFDGESCVVVSVADSAEQLNSSESEDEVVVSFAVSVELLWTDRIDGECCVLVVSFADSTDKVVVPHSNSKSTSDSDSSDAILGVICADVLVLSVLVLWRGNRSFESISE